MGTYLAPPTGAGVARTGRAPNETRWLRGAELVSRMTERRRTTGLTERTTERTTGRMDRPERGPASQPASARERAPSEMKAAHVLVVDDYDDTRAMCSEFFEFMGYRVTVAADGREAIDRAQERPDVILMDLSLPHVDGWDAIEAIKADPATREIPIIVLTGHALAPMRERALVAGCAAFVAKPCLPQDLLEHVRRVLEARPRRASRRPRRKRER